MKVIKKDNNTLHMIGDTVSCRFFPSEECKMSLTAEAIAKAKEDPEEYELALRPEPDSIACTNCLLVQLLSYLKAEEYDTVFEISKKDAKALKRYFNAK